MDPTPPTGPASPPAPPSPQAPPSDATAKVVYVLYLLSLVTGGLTHLVGVVIAYAKVGGAPEPVRSHYRFQIRTFWIGLLYGAVVVLLALAWIGFVAIALLALWLIIRCVKGLVALDRHEPYPKVETWLW
jgi:uncharacterized membrane protein